MKKTGKELVARDRVRSRLSHGSVYREDHPKTRPFFVLVLACRRIRSPREKSMEIMFVCFTYEESDRRRRRRSSASRNERKPLVWLSRVVVRANYLTLPNRKIKSMRISNTGFSYRSDVGEKREVTVYNREKSTTTRYPRERYMRYSLSVKEDFHIIVIFM